MKIADLRKFIEIVAAGGITHAAHRLGVTQPGLSRTVRDLELRMQAQLLRRTGRGIEVTAAGEAFLAFAQATIAAHDETQRRVLELSGNMPKSLTLSVPLRLGRLLIPDLHREFAQRMPETTVHLFEESSARSVELLDNGRLDAGLVYLPGNAAPAGDEPLFAETLFAVGTPQMLEAADRPLPLATLGRMPILLPSRGTYRALIASAFATAGISPRIGRELETAEALLAFAAEAEGIAILPYSNFYQECARGEVIARPIVRPEIRRVVALRPGKTLTREGFRVMVATVRASMSRVAHLARWRKAAT